MKNPPAVVIPSDRPASLGVARLLGRRGIPVYGIDSDPDAFGLGSKYLNPRLLPNCDDSEQNRLEYLLKLGAELGEAVLYPVRDNDVLMCSQYRGELQKYFHFVMPNHATVTSLLTKDGMHRIANQYNIPAPREFRPTSRAELESLAGQLPYPVILKPVFSPSWLREEIITLLRGNFLSGPPKVALCHNEQEILEIYDKIAVYDPRMVIEEVIPGEDERLLYYCFYLNRQSQPLATFAGKKIRVLPVGFGSATYVKSLYDPGLEEISLRLLSCVQYQGLGGIEFKKDPRDGQYKLIEFNARLGMWDSYGARCGVDIPYTAYCDTLGRPVERQNQYREGVLWIDFQRDVRAYLIYRQRKLLSFTQWLRSYQGEKEWAVYAPGDWKPAWIATSKLLERPIKSIQRRLSPAGREK